MKPIILCIALCFATITIYAQEKTQDRIMYGVVTTDSLTQKPYDAWYTTAYNEYIINTDIKKQINPSLYKNITIEAFFGNWCGDSKRELPRFIKTLDETNFNQKYLKLIAVGGRDSLYKQSPTGEHKTKGVFRVPVFIIYKNNKEIGRINEFPVQSIERDLLAILQNDYTPNYKSFGTVNKWLNENALADSNVNIRGLAAHIKPLVSNEYELTSVSNVLLKQNKNKEAMSLLRINCTLYPQSAVAIMALGDGYLKTGEKDKAILFLEKSIEYNPSPELLREILDKLYKAKGL